MLCVMPPRTRLALLSARTLLTHTQLAINQDPQGPLHWLGLTLNIVCSFGQCNIRKRENMTCTTQMACRNDLSSRVTAIALGYVWKKIIPLLSLQNRYYETQDEHFVCDPSSDPDETLFSSRNLVLLHGLPLAPTIAQEHMPASGIYNMQRGISISQNSEFVLPGGMGLLGTKCGFIKDSRVIKTSFDFSVGLHRRKNARASLESNCLQETGRPDGIHLRSLLKHVSMIFQWSLESREVPDNWKLVNTVLIFKKDKKEDPGNYSPVSLTSVPEKIMEKITLGSIGKPLKDNVVICCSRHGFMRGKS
ncbi:hypothetical protein WISP_15310 [Willisornis vidua]|uniref:Uncharacterized protein n=1 Tax=Willisornis vidua TaxID=1566151 RepID=A0ABQ9DVF5_9PASS|nr:hypothetical protein WISP_15310 [Willisornis vidua]